MCGILALLEALDPSLLEFISTLINNRGPDYQSPFLIKDTLCDLVLRSRASVLNLRSSETQKQPIVDEKNNVLLFNGQIYKFLGVPLENSVSDTKFLLDRLKLCRSKEEVAETFAEIDGPFAFIYFSHNLECLFYGRDIFGRRSLCELIGDDKQKPIIISSVASPLLAKEDIELTKKTWKEVDCTGFHCIDLSRPNSIQANTFLWNIDNIYPRTKRCPPSSATSEDFVMKSRPIAPLNSDSRPAENFSDIEKKLTLLGLEEKLLQAVKIRLHQGGSKCLLCKKTSETYQNCDHSKIAVAFSGGIDSTLLALSVDKVLDQEETIDLITVAFKENSPDRKSVVEAFQELCAISARRWKLVLCDISKQELQDRRDEPIKHLISPCKTVIDDSLGCACWFIGRAKGRLLDADKVGDIIAFSEFQPDAATYPVYTSSAAIVFVGASIDEQLGGYGSHRSAWSREGFQGLYNEISFLMRRISSRNLGRDDRTYADHGRDVKFPYLDFDLVSYLNQLPISLKMDLNDPSLEVGPKKILRELARHWDLKVSSRRVKRALQFGTRIANLENSKERGDEICPRLV